MIDKITISKDTKELDRYVLDVYQTQRNVSDVLPMKRDATISEMIARANDINDIEGVHHVEIRAMYK